MNTVLFVNATIGFSENLFLVLKVGLICSLNELLSLAKILGMEKVNFKVTSVKLIHNL